MAGAGVGEPRGRAAGNPCAPVRPYLAAILLVAYIAVVIAVIVGSPLDDVDRALARIDLAHHWPDVHPWVSAYVIAGQRGPSVAVATVYAIWRARRDRSLRPLLTVAVAVFLLNLSVGAVKLATGRLGPRLTGHARAVFAGGDIFPSGHTSNAVVIGGVLVLISAGHRRALTGAAATLAGTVGLSTIFLDTHWFTDVVGGWLAGGLVLLAVPVTLPPTERFLRTIANKARAALRTRPERASHTSTRTPGGYAGRDDPAPPGPGMAADHL